MSLGLMLINDDTNMQETLNMLEKFKNELSETFCNYIVYTKSDSIQFLNEIHKNPLLSSYIYDVTNEQSFVLELMDQFSVLTNVSRSGVKISTLL